MSFQENHRKIQRVRKMRCAVIDNNTIAERISNALRGYSDKELARLTGSVPRTIQNIRQRQNAPSAATLINLMRAIPEVNETVQHLAGRSPASSEAIIKQAMNVLGGLSNEINTNRVSSMVKTPERSR